MLSNFRGQIRNSEEAVHGDELKSCAAVKYFFNVTAYWSKAISVNCWLQSYRMKLKSIAFKHFIALEDPDILNPLGEF